MGARDELVEIRTTIGESVLGIEMPAPVLELDAPWCRR